MASNTLIACALGETSYRDGLRLQQALVDARAADRTSDWLLFPDHPPVLTVGRSPSEGNLRAGSETLDRLGIEVFEVARGGDITWHGPGQLVGYTIVGLDRRDRDLHRFLRELEEGLIHSIGRFGVVGERVPGRTGVWVEGEKIASLGIAVRRWVSYHGFALNVAPDLGFFELIHPCGLRGIHMTSLSARLPDAPPDLTHVRSIVAGEMARQLGYEELRWAPPDAAWEAAGSVPAASVSLEAGSDHAA